MKKLMFLAICIALIQTACNSTAEYQEGPLTVDNAMPEAGDEVQLTYEHNNSTLAGQSPAKAVIYYTVHSDLYAQDLDLQTKDDTLLETSFAVPDSALSFALLFSANDVKDTNQENGYVFPVYQNGSAVKGAYASMSQFYTGLGSQILETDQPADSALVLVKKEFKQHPNSRSNWNEQYFRLLNKTDKERALNEVQQAFDDSMAQGIPKERTLGIFYSVYEKNNDQEMADSLNSLLLKEYPQGKYAFTRDVQSLLRNQNMSEVENKLQKLSEQYPDSMVKNNNMLGFIYRRLANNYAQKGNFEDMERYANKTGGKRSEAGLYNSKAWNMAQKDKNLEKAESLSKRSLKLIEEGQNDFDEKPDYVTKSQWKDRMKGSYGMYADTYAYIQSKQNNYKDALHWQQKAVKANEGSDPEINERYIKFELKAGSADTALTKGSEWIKNGHSNAKMNKMVKKAYKKVKGSTDGFDAYLTDLKANAKKQLKEKLAKEVVNRPAPGFKLTDLDGNTVSLASLKGKIVVLDFWATWCGPCRVSFPGTKKAIEKFEDDKNVKFLFVNTWQQGEPDKRTKKVTDFIEKNNYPFHVLMDQKNKDDEFKVVTDYGVKGIPTKFVIDGEGNIRFKEVGGNSNIENQVTKISAMVDIIRS